MTAQTSQAWTPNKPPEELGKRINTYVAPYVEAWLRAQPSGMSKAIAHLVRQAMHAK